MKLKEVIQRAGELAKLRTCSFSGVSIRRRNRLLCMEAYEDVICHTATKTAPWYVVPADNKWFPRVIVAPLSLTCWARWICVIPRLTTRNSRNWLRSRKRYSRSSKRNPLREFSSIGAGAKKTFSWAHRRSSGRDAVHRVRAGFSAPGAQQRVHSVEFFTALEIRD
jgi:hypothetical protein